MEASLTVHRSTVHRSLSTRSRALAPLLLVLTGALACGGKDTSPTAAPAGSASSEAMIIQPGPGTGPGKATGPGLELRVSNGKQGPPAFDHAKLAPAKRLSDAEANTLLQRAKPIAADPQDQQAFALRAKSPPPPRTGQTIQAAFPPPASSLLPPPPAGRDATSELRVVRYMPEGKVPLAPELSVTFSQPMVAVTSQADAAAVTPVKLAPETKGRWRWIGTRTILFDPEVRFPQATTYSVEVPAGTRSASGAALKQGVTFSFETPPPTMVSHYPAGGPQHTSVPMFVLFDQKIDPQAVLGKLTVTAAGKRWAVRLLDAKALAADKQLASLAAGAKQSEQDGRWLAFRPAQDLPADATIEVELGAGTPSAEGRNPTTAPQKFQFQTYPPLRITRAECGWNHECRPGMPFSIELNNPLDADRFDDGQVTVTPAIDGVRIVQNGNSLTVIGATAPRTHYRVVVSGSVVDDFGQKLGGDDTRSWDVGDATPTFYGADGLVVLDPSAKHPTLDFFSTNYAALEVQLYAVTPADFEAYCAAMRNRWNHDRPPAMPGRKVFDDRVATNGGNNQLTETHVDLKPALGASGLGHAIAIVEPSPWTEHGPPPRMIAWVQSTRLGIDASIDNDSLVAYATELDTGKHAAGVTLELRPYGVTGTTDDQGLATLALAASTKGTNYLIAKRGNDVAFVMEDNGFWAEGGSWFHQPRSKDLAWYVTDDRKLYKPGEQVSIKGWLRTIDQGKNGDVGGVPGATQIGYQVMDSQGNPIAKGTAAVSAVGGFDTRFTLPKTPNLGYAQIEFEAHGAMSGSFAHAIQVEEFRRPEFEVSAQPSQGPFLVGGGGDITVGAKYFAGGPLAGAEAQWNVVATQTSFTPPNRDDYVFGAWTPWWGPGRGEFGELDEGGGFYRGGKPPKTWALTGVTDATGAHTLHLDFLSVSPAVPMAVTATATVVDVNRQALPASAQVIVHPAALYVGLKAKKPFVERGTPFALDVIGVDLDGVPAPGAKIAVRAVRLDWEYKKGRFATREVDPQTCGVTAAAAAVPCTFHTTDGGEYQVTATITDDKGRTNQTTLTFWVAGGEHPPAREVALEKLQLIPDQKTYTPGTTAELLVQAPFYPAEGVVSWRRSGIVKTEKIVLDGPTKVITVPISDAMVPNLSVQVELIGTAARTDDHGRPDPKLPRRRAYAAGTIELPVPPVQRTLDVVVTPAQAKLGPGETTSLALAVTDAAGRPVAGAEAAVIVVDESILSLTGAAFVNPIDTFYGPRGPDTRDVYSQAYLRLARPDTSTLTRGFGGGGGPGDAVGGAPGGAPMPASVPAPKAEAQADMAPMEQQVVTGMRREAPRHAANKAVDKEAADDNGVAPGRSKAIAIRSDFNPLAAFAPAVHTDAAGKATVEIKLPDNVTRYRVVAIAVAGDRQFGKGESALTARLPLMVRPSPPRFLNFGDTFRLPVVVQNQTDAAMTVRLAVRATNAALTEGTGRELAVPANDRVEVQFPAAAELAGTARFQIVGTAGAASDAAELALPVWTPATTEAFATYGVIDDGPDGGVVKQPVALPGKVVTQFGGIDVTTASTNLAALTDAVLYLVHYPFECAEQRSSRILAIAALKDVLAAFHAQGMPTASAMTASVAVDIEHLSQMQNGDGGFAFWDRNYPSEPYLTVFVANALGHARDKGFGVPSGILDHALGYLRNIESHYPAYYSQDVRWAISAFALYTRKQLGDLDVAKAKRLFAEAGADKLSMEASGWILATLAQNPQAADERMAIVRHALNHVSETAGAANFTTGYGDGNYLLLSSDRRVDAVMLDALIQEQKDLDLIPKVVTGLLGHRKAGRWLNTQENTFALVALDRYFQTYEKATPDFVARVWLGNDYAGDHAFKGRTTEDYAVHIAMKDVAAHDRAPLTIQKDGQGRLYYRIGMTYAPASLVLEPADYGFVVERSYEGVDDPKAVSRAADGTWHIKAGARVRVRLTLVNENRRYHVALVDPLPAGLETLNPALATAGPIPSDPSEQKSRGAYWWWYGPWYEHQNLRDERVEAFASLLWEGVHKYDYVTRATTPGSFVVPPPRAEEMYMPETFGRGASDRVVIE
ncbi:MAG TPA: alpha-2-macroglobulin family protein [Kofleriaceae bacterium]|nr:alpha-2-macroglobulin family protein [Kofleriaceae bacterium]